nr:type II toxin-antitoxin system PemK/MazF family toxin [Metallibacterium sp.]
MQCDQGKPRPALVIQSDFFAAHPSVTVLPVTSELRAAPLFRVDIEPGAGNGLRKPSPLYPRRHRHAPGRQPTRPHAAQTPAGL